MNDVETTASELNVNAREFIPRGTGTQHVWNVDAPSFVPSRSFKTLNVFAKEFVPRQCDFVKENRVDSPGSASVDICVPKCNDSQMVTCNQWFQCSESPECGGPYRLGDRCQGAQWGPRWQSGNTLASHLCGRGSIPVMAVSGKAGSYLPLVGSLQYRTLANYMYWFPLPFQLPVVI